MSANVIPFPVQRSSYRAAAVIPLPSEPAPRRPLLVIPFPIPPSPHRGSGPELRNRVRQWLRRLRKTLRA